MSKKPNLQRNNLKRFFFEGRFPCGNKLYFNAVRRIYNTRTVRAPETSGSEPARYVAVRCVAPSGFPAGAPSQLCAPIEVASCRRTKLDQNGAARYGVPHALHPQSINVMRESPTTPRPPWHAFICRQFAPTRAISARDASNRYKHSSLTSCAQRQCVRSLRRPEPSTCTQKEVEPEGCKRSTHIARNEHPINQPYGF